MSLAPFTTATPAAARSSLGLARASAPSARPATAGSSSSAASRAHATTRSDARGTAPAGKGREGFASVLAAAQDDAGATTVAPEARRTALETRDTSVERDHAESPASDAPAPQVATDEPPQPAIVSSWLLLALEHAPLTRSQGDSATGETVGGTPDAPAIDGMGLGTDAAGAVTPAVVGAAPLAAQGATPGTPAPIPEADATATPPSASASAGPRIALIASGPGSQVAVPAPPESEPGALEPTAGSASEWDAVDPSSLDGVPTEPAARWLASAHAAGRMDDMPVTGPSDVRPDTLRVEPATGTAVSRLAQPASRSADTGESGVLTPVAGSEGGGTPAASTPTARATEILQRLVPSAGDTGSRMHQDAGAGNAPPFATPLASAPAPAVVVEAAAVAASLPPAVGEQVTAQIVSSLKMQWKEGIGEAKLQLRPEGLGSVTVALRVEQGAVTAVVRAESAQVQDWVLQHQQTLRQQMEAAGLHLDELTVNPDDRGQHDRHRDAQPEQRRRHSRPHDASPDTPRFELLA